MTRPPRIGISRCLLGDQVRYDGTDRRDAGVLGMFGPEVEWVPVCPEVEIGMGTPREPIQLVARGDGVRSRSERVRLIAVDSGEDWTERMERWAGERVRQLKALDLAGYVLKAGSPSCGIDDVRVRYTIPGADAAFGERQTGRGLFAQALMEALPELPVEDERRLADPAVREEFLERIRRYRSTQFSGSGHTNT